MERIKEWAHGNNRRNAVRGFAWLLALSAMVVAWIITASLAALAAVIQVYHEQGYVRLPMFALVTLVTGWTIYMPVAACAVYDLRTYARRPPGAATSPSGPDGNKIHSE